MIEDRDDVLKEKLKTVEGIVLQNPQTLQLLSTDLDILPQVTPVDLYSFLNGASDEYTHSKLRDYKKPEGYGMYIDGHVLDLQFKQYDKWHPGHDMFSL